MFLRPFTHFAALPFQSDATLIPAEYKTRNRLYKNLPIVNLQQIYTKNNCKDGWPTVNIQLARSFAN